MTSKKFRFNTRTMKPANTVSALVVKYGKNSRQSNRAEEYRFNQIVNLLDNDMVVVEDYRTLGFGGDVDLDDDMGWGDAPSEMVVYSSQSSSASA